MLTTCPDPRARQGGFSIVAAIFILVVLATLASFIVSVTSTQSLTFAQDIQGARAYQAARAATEYGIARWLGTTPSAGADCAGAAVIVPLAGFDVTMTPTQSSGGGREFCTIVGRATAGTNAGETGYIEREIRVVVEGNP
jgi:MSHA biogenesis protein MshP